MSRRNAIRLSLGTGGAAMAAVACGPNSSSTSTSTASSSSVSATSAAAAGPTKFGMTFNGLIAIVYHSGNKEAMVKLVSPPLQQHQQRLVVNLAYLDSADANPDAIITAPGGAAFGIWPVKNDVTVDTQAGSGLELETPVEPPNQCPDNDPDKWKATAWLAKVHRLYNDPSIKGNRNKPDDAHLVIKKGKLSCVMPDAPGARTVKWVCKENGAVCKDNAGKDLLNQPLADTVLWTFDANTATPITIDTGIGNKKVKVKPGAPGLAVCGLANTPTQLPSSMGGSGAMKLDHFARFYDLLTGNPAKKPIPESSGACTMTIAMASMFGVPSPPPPGGQQDIGPIYCPPGLIFED